MEPPLHHLSFDIVDFNITDDGRNTICERLVSELRNRDSIIDRFTIKSSVSIAGTSLSLGEAELSPKRMPETLRKAMTERITALEKQHAGLPISIDDDQLQRATQATAGYPYMIQLVGYHVWNAADLRDSDTISDDDITNGIREASSKADFAVPFLREYLRRRGGSEHTPNRTMLDHGVR